MARTAAAARVARARDFGDARKSTACNLAFDRAFGNKEARAYERFVTAPVIARGVAILADRSEQRVASELRTVLSAGLYTIKTVVHISSRSFSRAFTDNVFSQQRR